MMSAEFTAYGILDKHTPQNELYVNDNEADDNIELYITRIHMGDDDAAHIKLTKESAIALAKDLLEKAQYELDHVDGGFMAWDLKEYL